MVVDNLIYAGSSGVFGVMLTCFLGCGQPPGIKNGTVKYPNDSVGSVAVYSCDVGFSLKGSRKQRKCRKNLQWSALKSHISCQSRF